MANGMMALQRQAAAWFAAYSQQLVAAGYGFTADDLAAVEASHAAHPLPAGMEAGAPLSAEDIAAAERVQQAAMAAEYPADGFAPDDPRIAPVAGVPLVALAVASRAIGWSTEPAFVARVLGALGLDAAMWEAAGQEWKQRATDDVVVAAFYGQLYSSADPLPRRC